MTHAPELLPPPASPTPLPPPADGDQGLPLVDREPPLPPPPRTPLLRIAALCIANFGLSCAWALEYATTTPYFEEALSAGEVVGHAVWIVGPLSGLIVAPLVGTLSDRCTHALGRRRPFIVAGIVASLVAMVVFPNAAGIAAWAFSRGSEAHRVAALVVAVVAFCVLDLAINTTMWPVRALQGDVVPAEQQHEVQAISVMMNSLGDLACNGVLNLLHEPVAHIRLAFLVVGGVFLITTSSLLWLAKEEPLTAEQLEQLDDGCDAAPRWNFISYLSALPPWMWRVGTTTSLAFFALFCFMPYFSAWLGSSVLDGDMDAGVELYSRASLGRTLLQVSFAAVYPTLIRFTTPGRVHGVAYVSFGLFMLFAATTSNTTLAKFAVVALGLPIAAQFIIPIGVTVKNCDADNRGRYLGAINCFVVIPQLIDTAYTGFVSKAFGEWAVMRIGGAWAIAAGVFSFFWMNVS